MTKIGKVLSAVFGLPETGVVDRNTWNDIYRAYAGIVESTLSVTKLSLFTPEQF